MKPQVIVIGGGASGMMAALTAAEAGADVRLLEKNDRLGKKLLITGKGRCNVTNSKDMEDWIRSFVHNGKFLYTALHSFSNAQTQAFFAAEGVPLKTERGGRVFPASDEAGDIVDALCRRLERSGAEVWLRVPVRALRVADGRIAGVVLGGGRRLDAQRVIVATGGASYPGTGSTGDGYRMARQAGHTVTPLRPSLVPLESSDDWVRSLQGLSLRNVTLRIETTDGKRLAEEFGEMLFTHFGISGPIVLTSSSKAVDFWQTHAEPLRAVLDLKPALSRETLDARLLREVDAQHNRHLKNALGALLPSKLIPAFLRQSGISGEKPMHQLTREDRRGIVELLKGMPFTLSGARPLAEAIVTAGGVSVREISPQTMESRLVPGLYFTGEVLDVDAVTGGFNLQAAFSTGYLAGKSCGRPAP